MFCTLRHPELLHFIRLPFVAVATAYFFLAAFSALTTCYEFSFQLVASGCSDMDIPRASSPPSIHVYDFNGRHGPQRSSSRSMTGSFSKPQRPMAILRTRPNSPPPPLPPPRWIDGDAESGPSEIEWRDTFSSGSAKPGGSVSPGSSLRGSWGQTMAHRGSAGRPDYPRESPNSIIKSQSERERKYDFSRQIDEGYHSLSGSSLVNQQSVHILFFLC